MECCIINSSKPLYFKKILQKNCLLSFLLSVFLKFLKILQQILVPNFNLDF